MCAYQYILVSYLILKSVYSRVLSCLVVSTVVRQLVRFQFPCLVFTAFVHCLLSSTSVHLIVCFALHYHKLSACWFVLSCIFGTCPSVRSSCLVFQFRKCCPSNCMFCLVSSTLICLILRLSCLVFSECIHMFMCLALSRSFGNCPSARSSCHVRFVLQLSVSSSVLLLSCIFDTYMSNPSSCHVFHFRNISICSYVFHCLVVSGVVHLLVHLFMFIFVNCLSLRLSCFVLYIDTVSIYQYIHVISESFGCTWLLPELHVHAYYIWVSTAYM